MRIALRRVWALLTVAALLTGAASALEQESRRPLTEAEAGEWIGVGRLNLAGNAYCSATLLTPNRVITAAHCLFNTRTGVPLRLSDIHFVAGWRRGAFKAHRKAKRVVIHPEFDYQGKRGRVRSDLALIELEERIGGDIAKPYSQIGNAGPDQPIFIVSYGRDRPHLPSIEDPCFVGRIFRYAIGMTCEAVGGVSGAPVFRRTEKGLRLVGVVSGRVENQGGVRSYAVRLGVVLPVVLKEFDKK